MEENFNKHLGNKLKLRRLALGLTQTKVAKAINVTFQQIQKYEKGTNGVSSIRLLQLSNYLKVPIKYFFEDFSEYAINAEKIKIAGILKKKDVCENETICSGISFRSICLPPLTINTNPLYKLNVPRVTIME